MKNKITKRHKKHTKRDNKTRKKGGNPFLNYLFPKKIHPGIDKYSKNKKSSRTSPEENIKNIIPQDAERKLFIQEKKNKSRFNPVSLLSKLTRKKRIVPNNMDDSSNEKANPMVSFKPTTLTRKKRNRDSELNTLVLKGNTPKPKTNQGNANNVIINNNYTNQSIIPIPNVKQNTPPIALDKQILTNTPAIKSEKKDSSRVVKPLISKKKKDYSKIRFDLNDTPNRSPLNENNQGNYFEIGTKNTKTGVVQETTPPINDLNNTTPRKLIIEDQSQILDTKYKPKSKKNPDSVNNKDTNAIDIRLTEVINTETEERKKQKAAEEEEQKARFIEAAKKIKAAEKDAEIKKQKVAEEEAANKIKAAEKDAEIKKQKAAEKDAEIKKQKAAEEEAQKVKAIDIGFKSIKVMYGLFLNLDFHFSELYWNLKINDKQKYYNYDNNIGKILQVLGFLKKTILTYISNIEPIIPNFLNELETKNSPNKKINYITQRIDIFYRNNKKEIDNVGINKNKKIYLILQNSLKYQTYSDEIEKMFDFFEEDKIISTEGVTGKKLQERYSINDIKQKLQKHNSDSIQTITKFQKMLHTFISTMESANLNSDFKIENHFKLLDNKLEEKYDNDLWLLEQLNQQKLKQKLSEFFTPLIKNVSIDKKVVTQYIQNVYSNIISKYNNLSGMFHVLDNFLNDPKMTMIHLKISDFLEKRENFIMDDFKTFFNTELYFNEYYYEFNILYHILMKDTTDGSSSVKDKDLIEYKKELTFYTIGFQFKLYHIIYTFDHNIIIIDDLFNTHFNYIFYNFCSILDKTDSPYTVHSDLYHKKELLEKIIYYYYYVYKFSLLKNGYDTLITESVKNYITQNILYTFNKDILDLDFIYIFTILLFYNIITVETVYIHKNKTFETKIDKKQLEEKILIFFLGFIIQLQNNTIDYPTIMNFIKNDIDIYGEKNKQTSTNVYSMSIANKPNQFNLSGIQQVFNEFNAIWLSLFFGIFNFLTKSMDIDIIYKTNKWNTYRVLKDEEDKVYDRTRQDIIIGYFEILSQVKLLVPAEHKISSEDIQPGWKDAIKIMQNNSQVKTVPLPNVSKNVSKHLNRVKHNSASQNNSNIVTKKKSKSPPKNNNNLISNVFWKSQNIFRLFNYCNNDILIKYLKDNKILPITYNSILNCGNNEYEFTNDFKGKGSYNIVYKIYNTADKYQNIVIRILINGEDSQSREEELSGLFLQKILSDQTSHNYCDGICKVYEFGKIQKNMQNQTFLKDIPNDSVYSVLEEVIPMPVFMRFYVKQNRGMDVSYIKIIMDILTQIIKVLKCMESHNFINYDLKMENLGIFIDDGVNLNGFNVNKSKITIKMYDFGNFYNLSENDINETFTDDTIKPIRDNYIERITNKDTKCYYNTYTPIEAFIFDITDTITHSAGLGWILAELCYRYVPSTKSVLNTNEDLSIKITSLINDLMYPIILDKTNIDSHEINTQYYDYSKTPTKDFSKQAMLDDIKKHRITTEIALVRIKEIQEILYNK